MKKTAKSILLTVISLFVFGFVFGTNTAAQTPGALVKDLYKTHDRDLRGKNDRILNGENRAAIDKYFDKTLADFMWKDLTSHMDEGGVLDFDPFYNAQDFDVKKLVVGQPKIAGNKATLLVTFENFGKKERLTYTLARQNSAWKISDIKYEDGTSLLKYFEDAAKK